MIGRFEEKKKNLLFSSFFFAVVILKFHIQSKCLCCYFYTALLRFIAKCGWDCHISFLWFFWVFPSWHFFFFFSRLWDGDRFGPDQIISTTVEWIIIHFGADIQSSSGGFVLTLVNP